MEPKDGGPAFPTATDKPFGDGRMADGGMTLRDYFAGQALVAFMQSPEFMEEAGRFHNLPARVAMCRAVYDIADSMLKARS